MPSPGKCRVRSQERIYPWRILVILLFLLGIFRGPVEKPEACHWGGSGRVGLVVDLFLLVLVL